MRAPMTTARVRELDPFMGFRHEFDELMRDFARQMPVPWRDGGGESGLLAPLDVAETKEALEISTELPGMAESDVTVSVEGQAVVISGEKKSRSETKEKDWRVTERSYGAFRRVVPLTFTPDAAKIKATFEKGVLHVNVAKPEEMVAKKVAIPIQKAG